MRSEGSLRCSCSQAPSTSASGCAYSENFGFMAQLIEEPPDRQAATHDFRRSHPTDERSGRRLAQPVAHGRVGLDALRALLHKVAVKSDSARLEEGDHTGPAKGKNPFLLTLVHGAVRHIGLHDAAHR